MKSAPTGAGQGMLPGPPQPAGRARTAGPFVAHRPTTTDPGPARPGAAPTGRGADARQGGRPRYGAGRSSMNCGNRGPHQPHTLPPRLSPIARRERRCRWPRRATGAPNSKATAATGAANDSMDSDPRGPGANAAQSAKIADKTPTANTNPPTLNIATARNTDARDTPPSLQMVL